MCEDKFINYQKVISCPMPQDKDEIYMRGYKEALRAAGGVPKVNSWKPVSEWMISHQAVRLLEMDGDWAMHGKHYADRYSEGFFDALVTVLKL